MHDAIIKQVGVGPMGNYAYILGDPRSLVCAVIDPGWDADEIIAVAANVGLKVTKILLTHSHFDHANAAPELAQKTGAEIYIHSSEASAIPKVLKTHSTNDGSTIELGDLEIRCMHTPGHTPGSQCFIIDGSIFTGDTLFVDGCGRVDLPGGDPRQMLSSLRMLAKLPCDTVVYPGHHYGHAPTSTIGYEVENNPYLTADSEGVLI